MRRWIFQFRDLLWALVALLLIEVALFYAPIGGFYLPLLKPTSYAGYRQATDLRAADLMEKAPESRWILILGNSISDQGFKSDIINLELEGTGHRALKLAQGGISPRTFYHVLKHRDLSQVGAVVVGVPFSPWRRGKTIETTWSTDKNFNVDLAALAALYGLRDQPRLALSLDDLEHRLQSLVGSVFKSVALRKDLKDFAADPYARLRALRIHPTGLGVIHHPKAAFKADRHLGGIRLDENGEVDISGATEWFKSSKRRDAVIRQLKATMAFQQSDPLDGKNLTPVYHPVLRAYLEDMARFVTDQGIPVLWVAMPSMAYPISDRVDLSALEGMAEALRAEGRSVQVFHSPGLLRRLQNPESFHDPLHMNQAAAAVLSQKVAGRLREIVAPAQAQAPAETDDDPS